VGPVSGGLFPPFLTAEQHLAPAFERFGFGGHDGNRLASSDGHGPWNEPEWSDSMLNGSDGTGKSAGSMIPTTSNNSSGGANSTMELDGLKKSNCMFRHENSGQITLDREWDPVAQLIQG
jgi:hypothetical protein